jgi:hypothetical protein
MFGCPIFVHVPKEKRKKMDSSGNNGIFLVIVTHRRNTRYIFPVTGKLRLVEMPPLMRVYLSANQNRTVKMKFMRRRMNLLEF